MTVVMKVEREIITGIAASSIGQAVILVLMRSSKLMLLFLLVMS
jgi:hypothetical protein